jgi:LPXTG-motif cell wall-anchored protein
MLEKYDTVIAVCTMKTKRSTDSGVTYEKCIFSSADTDEANSEAIDKYLDTIYFTNDMHLSAAWQLSCFDACLDYADPNAVFFSFDGGRGYDDAYEVMTQEIFNKSIDEFDSTAYPEPVLEHYDKTLKKLAQLMKNRAYYIMTAEGTHDFPGSNTVYNTLETGTQRLRNMTYLAMMIVDPVTMSTASGRAKMKEIINDSTGSGVNITNYVDENLFDTFGTEIYSYASEIKNTINMKVGEKYSITDIIDPRFKISGDITITVPTMDGGESYKTLKENTDYTLTITDDTASKGKKLTVKFLEWDGYPTMISVPIKLKDITAGFFDGNDFFDDTNVGDVSATVSDIVYNSATDENEEEEPRITILSDSPQLYLPILPVLPTAGGIGTGVFTVCGIALMALAILVLRTRKRYEHKE